MNKKTKDKPKEKKSVLLFIKAGLLLLSIYILAKFSSSSKNLFPISVICLISGVLFEGKRVLEKWSALLKTIISAAGFSFLALLPGKNEHDYKLEFHVWLIPYCFIFTFSFFSIVFNKNKVTAHLTEGITLLQSVAMAYWVIDLHIYETTSIFVKVLMVICLLFAIFTLFNAFTPTILSRTTRLTLSIWSSFIMLIFAIDNIYELYQNEPIESATNLPNGFLVGIQFFLLGVSTIYIVQNFLMLLYFLPRRHRFFNDRYYKEIKELEDEHINRYSSNQVNIIQALFCILITGGLFYLNYDYRFLPRQFAIWILFIAFPYLMLPLDILQTQRNKNDYNYK